MTGGSSSAREDSVVKKYLTTAADVKRYHDVWHQTRQVNASHPSRRPGHGLRPVRAMAIA
jgi:hypothetical protein